jgi:aminoglycoside phosphotransferase (APT) family kinase protein
MAADRPDPRRLAEALGRQFAGATDPLVDRVVPVADDLWRFRFRWREATTPRAAQLAVRLGDATGCRAEVRALREAQATRIVAPTVWVEEPWPVFDWLEGETFAGAWGRRAETASADALGELLAALHDGTERGGSALCHGAFRPERVLLFRGGLALVGWSRAQRGDPAVDLARATVHLAERYGGVLRTPFLRAYRRTRPIAPAKLARLEAELARNPDRL